MGRFNQGRKRVTGGIPASLFERESSGIEDESGGIDIPKEYEVEAIIHPVVAKGYISFSELSSSKVGWKDFTRALNLCRYDKWVNDYSSKLAKKEKEEVEYFD